MTTAKIREAAEKAARRGEDLNLAQAVEWMHDYGLMTYSEYKAFLDAQDAAYKAMSA